MGSGGFPVGGKGTNVPFSLGASSGYLGPTGCSSCHFDTSAPIGASHWSVIVA